MLMRLSARALPRTLDPAMEQIATNRGGRDGSRRKLRKIGGHALCGQTQPHLPLRGKKRGILRGRGLLREREEEINKF